MHNAGKYFNAFFDLFKQTILLESIFSQNVQSSKPVTNANRNQRKGTKRTKLTPRYGSMYPRMTGALISRLVMSSRDRLLCSRPFYDLQSATSPSNDQLLYITRASSGLTNVVTSRSASYDLRLKLWIFRLQDFYRLIYI